MKAIAWGWSEARREQARGSGEVELESEFCCGSAHLTLGNFLIFHGTLSHFICVWIFVTLRTVIYQAPLSMGFSRQEYWSGLPCPPPGDLPNPGIKPVSLTSPALAGRFFTTSATWEAPNFYESYLSQWKANTHTHTHTHIQADKIALGLVGWIPCGLVFIHNFYQESSL